MARDNLGKRLLDVLVILDSISVGLRCLTGNPRAKTDPRGCFPFSEGRATPPPIDFSVAQPRQSHTTNDRVSNCFPAVPHASVLPALYYSFPREATRQPLRSSTPRNTPLCPRKNAMELSDFTDYYSPLPVFFFKCLLRREIYLTNFIWSHISIKT